MTDCRDTIVYFLPFVNDYDDYTIDIYCHYIYLLIHRQLARYGVDFPYIVGTLSVTFNAHFVVISINEIADPQIATLLDKIVKSIHTTELADDLLASSILRAETETGCCWCITNHAELSQALVNMLRNKYIRPANNGIVTAPHDKQINTNQLMPTWLHLRSSHKLFEVALVSFSLDNASINDRILVPLISSIIANHTESSLAPFGARYLGRSIIDDGQDVILKYDAVVHSRQRRKIKQILARLNYLRVRNSDLYLMLKKHTRQLATNSNTIYDDTGIIMSQRLLSKYATGNNLAATLSRLYLWRIAYTKPSATDFYRITHNKEQE